MIGTTLSDIRQHIESLASPTGRYYLVCGRTGERPIPADGLYFDCRPTAQAAATATEQYRTALRRYDTQLPRRDVIVCEQFGTGRPTDDPAAATELATQPDGGRSTVEFCHTVAGVVFEAIADSPHATLQRAIMDRYLALAERVDHPDELCRRLLESLATELDAHLSADQQAEVLRAAATNLPAPPAARGVRPDPLESALQTLRSVALVETYAVDRPSVDCAAVTWAVTIDNYPFVSDGGRFVSLPLVVECFRRLSTVGLRISGVERTSDSPPSWRFELTATAARSSGALTVVEPGVP
ncbi:MAG: DUF7551 domain-containing protein [Halohasta sp.]